MPGLLKGLMTHAPLNLSLIENPFQGIPPKRVLITGATGFIGSLVTELLLKANYQVIVLTRSSEKAIQLLGPQIEAIEELDALPSDSLIDIVINLAGQQIVGLPWSSKQRQKLLDSRIKTTEKLANWLAKSVSKPSLIIQASAIGFYGVRPSQEVLTEESLTGQGFMAELCREWEKSALLFTHESTRVVTFRLGVVFGQGGALPKLALPFYFGLGGKLGDGKQIMSWVHREDVVRAIAFAMRENSLSGIFNLVAPETIAQNHFAKTLGQFIRRPSFLPLPKMVLTTLLGEMSDVFVGGQNVSSQKLQATGFIFNHPTLLSALKASATLC